MANYMKNWLKLEGLAVLVASIGIYAHIDASWWLFALLILAPDLGMLGYLAGPRVGAFTYNLVHIYMWPGALVVWSLTGGPEWALAVATIWAAHIGVDRALGFGLKGPDAFQQTHLGWVGD
ncbi:MAG: DUF4260 domain-containing protein [Longimicrobiales bacterium]|nr:DUF4260 domain-containing protein [Longimicrobiales bacterium]